MAKLISFDIDGTFEFGDPPGPVTTAMVRRARELGWVIGSSSDRPLGSQAAVWQRANIEVDFTCLKHNIEQLRTKFEAEAYFHIGDTDLDRHYAEMAGFEFLPVLTTSDQPWMLLGDPTETR